MSNLVKRYNKVCTSNQSNYFHKFSAKLPTVRKSHAG